MSITPEQCAELSKYTGEIAISKPLPDEQGMVFVTFWNGKGCCGRRLPERISNLLVSLPAILALVAEQQQRIEELESVIKLTYKQHCGRDLMHLPLNEAMEQSIAHIKREAMQRAVDICEELADALQSSDCSDCAETIKEEMDGIG